MVNPGLGISKRDSRSYQELCFVWIVSLGYGTNTLNVVHLLSVTLYTSREQREIACDLRAGLSIPMHVLINCQGFESGLPRLLSICGVVEILVNNRFLLHQLT